MGKANSFQLSAERAGRRGLHEPRLHPYGQSTTRATDRCKCSRFHVRQPRQGLHAAEE